VAETPQGSVQAEGVYGTAAGAEHAEAVGDPAAAVEAIALRAWRQLLLFFLQMRLADRRGYWGAPPEAPAEESDA
jgi:hypothetical protein